MEVRHKAIQLINHCVIVKDNAICSDREIRKRNKFHSMQDAQKWINEELDFESKVNVTID